MKLINFLTLEEVTKLLKAEKRKEYKLAIALGFGSGLRISEIVGGKKRYSKCHNVEVEFKILLVRNYKGELKEKKRMFCKVCNKLLLIKDTYLSRKKDDWSIPPLSPDMIDLKEHQIRVIQGKGKKDRITVTSPWLNETNIKILPLKIPQRTLQYNFNVLTEKVLGKRCNFHMLRHGFGNYMVNEKNVPMPMVQQMMGHSRIDTTGIYTRANPKKTIEAAWGAFK